VSEESIFLLVSGDKIHKLNRKFYKDEFNVKQLGGDGGASGQNKTIETKSEIILDAIESSKIGLISLDFNAQIKYISVAAKEVIGISKDFNHDLQLKDVDLAFRSLCHRRQM